MDECQAGHCRRVWKLPPSERPTAPQLWETDAPASLDAASNQDAYFRSPGVCLRTNATLPECLALPSVLRCLHCHSKIMGGQRWDSSAPYMMALAGYSTVEQFIQAAFPNRGDNWIPGPEGGGCWCEAGCEPVTAVGEGLVFVLWPLICVCLGRSGVLVTLGAEFTTSPETEFLNSFVFK